jgi:CPA2 family monovalent cation:H+ antiporter-2
MSLAQIGEFSFIIAGVGLATGATRPFLYPVAVAVSAITTLTTPWLIRAAGPAAAWVDRSLPEPLQNLVALYGSWMERARGGHSPEGKSRARRLAGLLVLDATVLGMIALSAWQFLEPASRWMAGALGIGSGQSRLVVLALSGLAGLPFAIGLVRLAGRLAEAIAVRALPKAERGKVDLGLAPRRAFVVTWQLMVVLLLSVPLLAVGASVMPLRVVLGLLVLVVAGLGFALWKSATNLAGHTKASAEVIVAALARQLAPAAPAHITAEQPAQARQTLAPIYSMIPGLGEPVPYTIEPGDFADGRSLAELHLRDATDASVLVIVRDGQPTIFPQGTMTLRAGDVLALAGSSVAVDQARALLKEGPAQAA